jgi:hypothetical protein
MTRQRLAGHLLDLCSDVRYLLACDAAEVTRLYRRPESLHEQARSALYAALPDGETISRSQGRALLTAARAYRAMRVFDEPWAVDAGRSIDCTLRALAAELGTERVKRMEVAAA